MWMSQVESVAPRWKPTSKAARHYTWTPWIILSPDFRWQVHLIFQAIAQIPIMKEKRHQVPLLFHFSILTYSTSDKRSRNLTWSFRLWDFEKPFNFICQSIPSCSSLFFECLIYAKSCRSPMRQYCALQRAKALWLLPSGDSSCKSASHCPRNINIFASNSS